MKGKLIVIEGGDGSGKTVQSKRLVEYFKKKGRPVNYIEFPRYEKSFYGNVVARFLSGEFGKLDEVSPYLAAIVYALDRLDARQTLVSWIEKGNIVVANRYVPSNMAHQTAKLVPAEQEKFIAWIEEMEYAVNKLPKPDLVIYLHVPWNIGKELTLKQDIKNKYIGKEDIAEKNSDHRIRTEAVYRMLAKKNKGWVRVNCVENGSLLSEEVIHEKVASILAKY